MALSMSIPDILKEYREARDKKAQIPILADQNGLKPWEMAKLLRANGADVDARWYKSPQQKKEERDERAEERAALVAEQMVRIKEEREARNAAKADVQWLKERAQRIAERTGADPWELFATSVMWLTATGML